MARYGYEQQGDSAAERCVHSPLSAIHMQQTYPTHGLSTVPSIQEAGRSTQVADSCRTLSLDVTSVCLPSSSTSTGLPRPVLYVIPYDLARSEPILLGFRSLPPVDCQLLGGRAFPSVLVRPQRPPEENLA